MKDINSTILKEKEKLELLITNNATYSKILKQSQILDTYINQAMCIHQKKN